MSARRSDTDIVVRPPDRLTWKGRHIACAIGKGGVRANKREGDGATPTGCFPLRRLLYRADRLPPPRTALPVAPLSEHDGWCDDPDDPHYNQQVRLPYGASHEALWRADHIYDVIVILGYNDDPIVRHHGSAIFLHLARPAYAPTEGCIAVALDDLLKVLESADSCTRVCIPDG